MKQAAKLLLPLIILVPGVTYTISQLKSKHPTQYTTPPTSSTDVAQQETEEKPAPGAIPAQSLYQLLTAELALDREQPGVALANYIAAAKETQDPKIAARATQIALTTASLEDAVEPAMIWAKGAPDDLEAQITTAALFIRLNEVDKALPYLQQAQTKNTEEAFQYFLVLYKQLQNENDNKNVVSALEKLTKSSDLIAGYLALSEIYLFQGDAKKALKLIDAALEKVPDSSLGIQLKSEALVRIENKQAAKAFLDKMVPKSNNPLLKQYYTQFLFENGFQAEAKEQLALLANNGKVSPEDQIQFARLAMQSQWYDIAIQILKNASKHRETQDLSHYFLGRVHEEQNNLPEAIDSYQQVLSGPFHVLSQLRASVLLADKKEYEKALKVLARTQPMDEIQKKQVVLTKIDILNQAKRHQDALDILNEELKLTPDEIDLLYARSLVADHLNQIPIAIEDLKHIIRLKPNHVDALNALGFMMSNKTKQYADAKVYLDKALKLSPNNPSVLDSVGWYYYKTGDYKQALVYLKKASDLSLDAEIAAHLGEVMWRLQDYEGAKKVWNTALERFPKHEQVLNAMNRMMTKNSN